MSRGAIVSLELAPGVLSGQAAAQAARLGLRPSPARDGAVVVVDSPDLERTERWAPPERLVVFDDRDAFDGHAAIVIQPSLPTWSGPGAADRVLAGYQYTPIARRFRDLRAVANASRPHAAPGRPRRLLVCFGGSDPHGITERLAAAFAGAAGWTATAIVGAYHATSGSSPIAVVRDPVDLAERAAACDLALLGGGTMKFEVACLGRPSILVAAADDQLAVGPPFAATGAAVWLGDGRTIDPGSVRRAVDELIVDDRRLDTIADRALAVIDGRGSDRLADAIVGLATAGS